MRLTTHLFGRHIGSSAGYRTKIATGNFRLVEAESKIDQRRRLILSNQNVRRLNIAMHRESRVRVPECIGNGRRNARRLLPARPSVLEPFAERNSLNEIRDDVYLFVLHTDIMHRYDAGMAQSGDSPSLLQETLPLFGRHLFAASEQLNRHGAVQL